MNNAIDWSTAPEWATSHGIVGLGEYQIWLNSSHYEYLAEVGKIHNFNTLGCWKLSEVINVTGRPGVTPTLEQMLSEWVNLKARALAAQNEADALFEHAGECHGEIVVRLDELGWGAPRGPSARTAKALEEARDIRNMDRDQITQLLHGKVTAAVKGI